jgi:uncharacterized protein YukE
MSDSIVVDHGVLDSSVTSVAYIGEELAADGKKIMLASNTLSTSWQGVGSDAFMAAAETLAAYIQAGAVVVSAESVSLGKANINFKEQDESIAQSISE